MSSNGPGVVELCAYVKGFWKHMSAFPWSHLPMASSNNDKWEYQGTQSMQLHVTVQQASLGNQEKVLKLS